MKYLILLPISLVSSIAFSAETTHQHDEHSQHQVTEISQPETHQHNSQEANPSTSEHNHSSMNHDNMNHDMSSMQGGNAPADARHPDYSQGRVSSHTGSMHNHAAWSVRINQLEQLNDEENTTVSEGVAWYGTDSNRLRLTWDIEHNTQDTHQNISLAWQKPLDGFWNYEWGVAYQDEQAWLKLNINGLMPYRFEVESNLLLNEQGHSLLSFEAHYDFRLTQHWVLQPSLSANLSSHTQSAQLQGKGLTELKTGLRLRYDVTRRFAPYLGIQQHDFFAKTADLRAQQGQSNHETTLLAGVRWWF
ncbi:MAG: copper resistance protein B [Moraxellaceae bacterium]|nr:copper resistance protein B [Moraxellaceae bacterium]